MSFRVQPPLDGKKLFKVGERISFVFETVTDDRDGNQHVTSTVVKGEVTGFLGHNVVVETQCHWNRHSYYVVQPRNVLPHTKPGALIEYLRDQYFFLKKEAV